MYNTCEYISSLYVYIWYDMHYATVAREITILPQLSACRGAAAAVGRSRRPRRRRPRKTKAVGTLVDAAREGWNPTPPLLVAGRTGSGGGGRESARGSPPKTNSFRFGPPWGLGWEGDYSRQSAPSNDEVVHFRSRRSKRTCTARRSPSSDYIGSYIYIFVYVF